MNCLSWRRNERARRATALWARPNRMLTPEQQRKTFFFEGNAVGYFTQEPLPAAPGQYRYMPYRGPGHYRLGVALRSAGPQRCHYVVDKKKMPFTVVAWVSYGLLELKDFELPES